MSKMTPAKRRHINELSRRIHETIDKYCEVYGADGDDVFNAVFGAFVTEIAFQPAEYRESIIDKVIRNLKDGVEIRVQEIAAHSEQVSAS